MTRGRVIGVVSEADMLNKEADLATGPGPLASVLRFRDHDKAAGVTAAELMTSPPVTASPETTAGQAARLMRDRRVKRLPVINATGHLIGIISRADVLSVFTRPDADIRREATEEVIAESFLVDSRRFAVTVHDGIVTLTGRPETDQAGRDLVEVLRHIEGVIAVRDQLSYAGTTAMTHRQRPHARHQRARPGRGRRRHACPGPRQPRGRGAARHLRTAALLRGVPARPVLHRATGHHRASVRHLPRRLPDKRLPGDRGRVRGTPGREIAGLRRLLYCGEWIGSHALHIYMLHAPDFLGYPGVVEMAADHREVVERGLALRRAGNAIMELLGGRAIHPVNVRVGGFYRAPSAAELAPLARQLRDALPLALDTVRWVAGFDFPDFTCPHELLALTEPGRYPIERGTLVTSGGLAFPAAEFEQHIIEEQVPHSTALHARLDRNRARRVTAAT